MTDDQVAKEVRAEGADPVGLETVLQEEREAIQDRRSTAGYNQPQPHNDLVGVALSGGGLRSAMFNLGLLQALQESGFMKYVDYLSTVSGGGYIGGFYSSIGQNFTTEKSKSGHNTTDAGCKPDQQADKRQYIPELYRATHRFINAGQYLNQPWAFFAGYLCPSLAVFLLFFSGMVMTASLIALFLRCFDLPIVNDHLTVLNLNSEMSALCLAIGSLWLVFLLIYYAIRLAVRERRNLEISRSAKYGPLLRLLVLAVLCGVAIMLGNYDFGLMSGASIQFQNWDPQTPIIIVSVLGALALFRLPLLLRSEQQTASLWQKAALWSILSVAVGGSSLAVLSLVGSEGISGYAAQRGPRLDHEDIIDNRAFAKWLDEWNHKVEERVDKTNPLQADLKLPAIEKSTSPVPGSTMTAGTDLFKEANSLDQQRRSLFPDDFAWRGNPEAMLHLDDAARTLRYLTRWLHPEDAISTFLTQQSQVRKVRNDCVDELNDRIFYRVTPDPTPRWHFWDTTATSPVDNDNLDSATTRLLLAAFSDRVQASKRNQKPDSIPSKPTAGNASKPTEGNASKPTEGNASKPTEGNASKPTEGNASDLKSPDKTPSAEKPGEMRADILAYLKASTNHAQKPLLGTTAFLKTLEPMIQPDGTLLYKEDSLDPARELLFRRQLLEMTDPHIFKQKAFISSPVVVGKDQAARLWIFVLSAVCFVVLCYIVDFNQHAAIFQFYRERIARTFIEAGSRNQHDANLPLSGFAPWEKGFPYPLIVAALKLPQSVDINRHKPYELDRNPAKVDGSVGSEWYSFLLSPKYVGYLPAGSGTADSHTSQSKLKTYRRTDLYLNDELKVSDAVTLSGAAFTPWMSTNSALNLLMHVFNLRLEQWLPNPSSPVCLDGKQPMKVWNILRERVRCSTSDGLKRWQHGIVADGGFREFLGVEELIARRCRIVVVSDAGCNNGLSEFGVLADLVRKLRLDHDVRILDLDHDLPLDTQRMHRSVDGHGVQHFIAGRIRYPETEKKETLYQRTGLFVYVQMSLTGDEDIDLAQFQKLHPTFPDEPITNQFFTADQVESLRQLGHHVGRHLCQRFDPKRIEREDTQAAQQTTTGNQDGPQGERKPRIRPSPIAPTGYSSEQKTLTPEEEAQEHLRRASEARVERLADALVGAYLFECRQEQLVGKDDTPPDQPVIDGELDDAATEAFRDYEERSRGSRLAHFVTCVVDGFTSEDDPEVLNASPAILKLANEIEAKELTGLAVECNRRHVGFRSENPDRFFRIGGRRLLLRSTSRAIKLCETLWPANKPSNPSEAGTATDGAAPQPEVRSDLASIAEDDARHLFSEDHLLLMLRAVSRLAATVPDGIFRSHGVETARDLTLCVLSWIAGKLNEFGLLHDRLRKQINRDKFRRGLKRAIRSRLADEICDFLHASLKSSDAPPGDAIYRHATKPAPDPAVVNSQIRDGAEDDEGATGGDGLHG